MYHDVDSNNILRQFAFISVHSMIKNELLFACNEVISFLNSEMLLIKLLCVCSVCRCWLRVDNYFIWSFIGPVSFIIMVLFSPNIQRSHCFAHRVCSFFPLKSAALVISNKALLFTYGSVAADGYVLAVICFI